MRCSVDRDKVMVWTFAVAALLQRGTGPTAAANDADRVIKEFEKRRDDGFFREKDDRT